MNFDNCPKHYKGGAAAPPPIAPVTMSSADTQQASYQAKLDAKRRRGLNSTLFAGETGGASNVLNKTLLGK